MRTQMSLLLSTSWRLQPWIITYLARHSVFNIKFNLNSHHLSDTEAVAKVVEGVVPEAGASTETLFFVNLV